MPLEPGANSSARRNLQNLTRYQGSKAYKNGLMPGAEMPMSRARLAQASLGSVHQAWAPEKVTANLATRFNPVHERRISCRQAMELPVTVEPSSEPPKGENGSAIRGLTRDISNRGAYFWAAGPFEPGQQLRLCVEIPPEDGRNYRLKIRWQAEVIRVDARLPSEQASGIAVRVLRFETPTVMPGPPWWVN